MQDTREKTNVMFVVPCFGYGGLEQVILNIVSELDRSRFAPSFCTLIKPQPDLYAELQKMELPCYILDKGEGINPALFFRLRGLLKKEEVTIVNAHDIGATLYAAPAARMAGIGRVIHTDHSQILTKTKYRAFYKLVLNRMVTHSVTVSSDLQNYLQSEFNVTAERITTIPNGIDIDRFSSADDLRDLYEEFGLSGNEMIIGSIGRLTEQKGMAYLLEAFKKVCSDLPNTKLVIVGDGELKGELEERSRSLGIGDRVIFTGIRSDIPRLLKLFDIFVLPSLWEGQPITIMEAMAAGRPIIATDAGGNSEILAGGRYGLVVPRRDPGALAESILLLAGDGESAAKLASDASSFARRELGHVSMVRKYEEVFLRVLETG